MMLHDVNVSTLTLWLLLAAASTAITTAQNSGDDPILSYVVDPKTQDLQLYWKDDEGKGLRSIRNLKTYVESKNAALLFAMNGGMFNNELAPQGLFIQNQKLVVPIDTTSGHGNFYLKPNGVFYITTDNTPFVCKTDDFTDYRHVRFATQSGPMLVIDGQIHPAFKQGSNNRNIRNGVGILPNHRVVFAMSKTEMSFYDFANYFRRLGCKNALYLDGFVSRAYLPEKGWVQNDGEFGAMIGVTSNQPTKTQGQPSHGVSNSAVVAPLCERCDIEKVKQVYDHLDKLDSRLVSEFLCTFHDSCKTNVEYSEFSNETLFAVLQKAPSLFFQVLANGQYDNNLLLEEIRNPVDDQIDIPAIYNKVKAISVRADLKKRYMDALEMAARKVGVKLTKATLCSPTKPHC